MSELRAIDAAPFRERFAALKLRPRAGYGDKPKLTWVGMALLRVDPAYQREIRARGASNIIKIALEFDWSRFSPLIVVEHTQGLYLVIDGQHRATAAALRGIRDLPCAVYSNLNRAQQAAAFAAVNGNTIALGPQQIFHAKLGGGDPEAKRLADTCALAEVTIAPYPIPAEHMKPGQSNAVSTLKKCLRLYGEAIFVAALRCITRTGNGVGWIRAAVIEALCATLASEPGWMRSERKLIEAMGKFNFAKEFQKGHAKAIESRTKLVEELIELVANHLDKQLGECAA